MIHARRANNKKAFSLIEVLVAVVLFTIFSSSVVYLSLDTMQRDAKHQLQNESLAYAQEGLEAARMIADSDFLNLTEGDHGLTLGSGNWDWIAAPETVDDFYERTITIEDVYRDVDGDIAEAGTLDPNTKKIVSTVDWTWKTVVPKTVSLTTYVTNWISSDWKQTTCDEFNEGVFYETELEEAESPPEDNCSLQLRFLEEPTPFFASVNVGTHGNDVIVHNDYIYIAANKSATGLAIADVTDAANPILLSQIDVGGKGRYLVKDGNYIYMGVESGSKGLVIADISDPENPDILSSTNIGGYGNQADIQGDYLFMGTNSSNKSFRIYDVSDGSDPDLITYLDLDVPVISVQVEGDYAYIGVEDDDAGFLVIDISDVNNPTQVAALDVDGEVNAIYLYGTFAYAGIDEDDESLKVINIATPTAPALLNTLNVNGEIEDMAITDNYMYATLDQVDPGLAVLNVTNPPDPYLAFNLDVQGKATGVDVDNYYAYIGIDVNNQGVVIIETIDSTVSTSGTYISDTLDTGSSDTRFNYLEWEANVPVGNTLTAQIRTADTEGTLSSATWVGPDGTGASCFDVSRTPIVLDEERSGQRYLQIKLFMTSDGTTNSTIDYLLINYTP